MPLRTMRELLIDQLNELYAAEKHGREVLSLLTRSATSSRLGQLFREHADETVEHLSRLEAIFRELGTSPSTPARVESKASKGLCEDCLRLASQPDADPAVRDAALIAVAQHVEHDEIAGYGCARTWAELLGHEGIAARLYHTLIEERRADAELSRLAESLNKRAMAGMLGARD